MRIFGAVAALSSSHSVGVAISSPSLSRPVMSAITVGGSAAGSWIFLPRLAIGAVVGEFAQDALQLDAVGVLQAEFARDLAGADLARISRG